MTDGDFNVTCLDPSRHKTDGQLEQFLLFSIAVAGKTANTVDKQLTRFLEMGGGKSPLRIVQNMIMTGGLRRSLKKARLGRYNVLDKAYRQLVQDVLVLKTLNLRTCTVDQLERVHGVGPKTARFFIMYTQPGVPVAALDTHVLKFLAIYAGRVGYKGSVSVSTPSGKKYKELEKAFLLICLLLEIEASVLDTIIWLEYSGNGDVTNSDRF